MYHIDLFAYVELHQYFQSKNLTHHILKLVFCWRTADLQCVLVSGVQQSEATIHIHTPTLSLDSLPIYY